MAMIFGTPGPMGQPSFKPLSDKEYDQALKTQMKTLGFSEEYVNTFLKQVTDARAQYSKLLETYLGKPDPKAPKDPQGMQATSLYAAQFQAHAAGALVMQQVAMAQLFPGLGATPR